MSNEKPEAAMSDAQIEWINLHNELRSKHNQDFTTHFKSKFKENPFVPIGCLATATVLCFGIYNMQKGNARMSQMMMRLRVAAQGLTVVALVTGVVLGAGGSKRKN